MTGTLIHGAYRVRFEDLRDLQLGIKAACSFVSGIVATATRWKFIILRLRKILDKHGI
jgi:hypothetical protein